MSEMVACRCGATDKQCIVRGVRVEGGEHPALWVVLNAGLCGGPADGNESREFMMYLDANAIVQLTHRLKAALVEMA